MSVLLLLAALWICAAGLLCCCLYLLKQQVVRRSGSHVRRTPEPQLVVLHGGRRPYDYELEEVA